MHFMEQILCPLRLNAKVLKMQNCGENYANDMQKFLMQHFGIK